MTDSNQRDQRAGVAEKTSTLQLLRTYAWPHRWSFLGGALFLGLTNFLSVSIPGEIGQAVDALRGGQPAVRHAAAIAVMGFAIIGVRALSRILIFNPVRDMEFRFRQDLFAHLLRLPPAFYAKHRRGDIVSRASSDIGWVRVLVGFGSLSALNVTLALALTGWKMVALSARLTVLTILPVVIGMAVVQWGIRRLISLYRRNQEQLGEISDHVLGSLQGMATIQGFAAEDAFAARFEARNLDWLRTGMKMALVRSLVLPLLGLAGALAAWVLVVVGGGMVEQSSLTVGELTAFVALLTVLLPPLRALGWLVSVGQRGRAALDRLLELMDAPAVVTAAAGEAGTVVAGPEIRLDGLSFSFHDGGRPVLDDIHAVIPAGAMVGIFGRTGSGKTTLLRLLARLEELPPGVVLVDGADLAEVPLQEWRRRVVLVPQRPFLFSENVAFNVALEEEPSMERVDWAVHAAALDDDLESMRDGIDTVVGERGIMLSGGQRQRAALARGLYRGGGLLLLDDVLSAVDHATEARLVATLGDLSRGPGKPTVVVASHRLSVLQRTSHVLVLERGRLTAAGPFDELVSRQGPLRDAWIASNERPAAGDVRQEAS